jgi:imidazolonepropionase-like amidohydrolase
VVLRGRLWPGGDADPLRPEPDGVVVVDPTGTVVAVGPVTGVDVPDDRPLVGGAGYWVGPAAADGHVHLAFAGHDAMLRGGVVAARDLGVPLALARSWAPGCPQVWYAGEILTAPGGYPSRGWGADGFARFVADPDAAAAEVDRVADAGASSVKLAFEPAGGPVPDPATAAAVVDAAHRRGLPAVAHALTVAMVERALDAGVDELVHTPVQRMPAELVARIAAAGVAVTSTLWTFAAEAGSDGATAAGGAGAFVENAAALLAAGVALHYGTDLGNTGTRPGVEPRELTLLAAAGLGAAGALRAVTGGWPGRPTSGLVPGSAVAAVLLRGDPLADAQSWRRVAAAAGCGLLVLDAATPVTGRAPR